MTKKEKEAFNKGFNEGLKWGRKIVLEHLTEALKNFIIKK